MLARIIKDTEKLTQQLGGRSPFDLAGHFDIEIREDRLGNLKGYIFFQSRMAVICLNRDLADELRPVVVCHEIGHYLYHRKKGAASTFGETSLFLGNCQKEYEANLFAAEFLLPDDSTLEQIEEGRNIFQAAAALQVPPELLDFKLKFLKHKGYPVAECLWAAGDFLKH
ncbi:MAG: ImmA/IrrE family metallo-endopeptidase [Peptococcaceae bacterium]|nr:ImmA/IrrE family metallo-endopeptidase [Peptococcaceae bacterium]